MDELIKLHSSTSGKEKLFKLGQFMCRLHWAVLSRKKDGAKETIQNLQKLESMLATVRRFLRLGDGIILLYSFNGVYSNDSLQGLITSMAKVSTILYFLTDHLVLLKKTNLIKAEGYNWVETSNKFLLMKSFLSLLKDINDMNAFIQHYQQTKQFRTKELSYRDIAKQFVLQNQSLSVNFLRNLCDTLIALDSTNNLILSPVKLSLLGCLSSVFSISQAINPAYRVRS